MDQKKRITVNIINRNYPPGPGITGESALNLTEYLLAKNIEVNIIHVNAKYSGGAMITSPAGSIYKIKTFYNGKSKIPRLVANLYEGWKLVQTSKKIKPDVTICMTDPPLLNIWASLLLGKKHKWIWWSMDLYPDAFAADGLVSKNNLIYNLLTKLTLKGPPTHVITLGPCQTLFLQKRYGNVIGFTQLPCGIYATDNENKRPSWASDVSKIYIGYCGNLGEAHSTNFLIAAINSFDPSRYTFILSVYGAKAKSITEFAQTKNGVVVLDSVKRSELSFIDIHLASLKPNWVNVCVPSKSVSSVCAGAALLYCGIAQSDNWVLLQNAGWRVEDNSTINETLQEFFATLNSETINIKKQNASKIANNLIDMKYKAYNEIVIAINQLTGKSNIDSLGL